MKKFIEITNLNRKRKEIIAIDAIHFISDADGYAGIHMKEDLFVRTKETVEEIWQKIKESEQENVIHEVKQKAVDVKVYSEGYNLGFKTAINTYLAEMKNVLKDKGLQKEEIEDTRRTIIENIHGGSYAN